MKKEFKTRGRIDSPPEPMARLASKATTYFLFKGGGPGLTPEIAIGIERGSSVDAKRSYKLLSHMSEGLDLNEV